MADSAPISFLTRTYACTHVRTYARTPGKPVYRGGTGPPKNVSGVDWAAEKYENMTNSAQLKLELWLSLSGIFAQQHLDYLSTVFVDCKLVSS